MINKESFQKKMDIDGWALFPSIVNENLLDRLKHDLEIAYKINRDIQKRNGVDFEGVAHHMIKSMWGRGSSFYELLENLPLKEYAETYFGAPFILNTFSGIINLPDNVSKYQHRPHRDMRTYFPVKLSLNMLIMLDDFTAENGATYIYGGSHLKEEMPSEEEFYKKADRAIGKAGSVILFNSNVVHATGHNKTDKVRRCIPPTFVRSFMKQQCEFSSLITDSDSEWLKQLLGYNARVSKDLNEWYQPPERRMYKPGQG